MAMFNSRATKPDTFHHVMKIAWDVGKGDGRRTVMYESMSMAVHKNDLELVEVKVPEFNIIELVSMEKGFKGLVAVELRSYIGTNPIVQRVWRAASVSSETEQILLYPLARLMYRLEFFSNVLCWATEASSLLP
ncbi:hypothetical protein EPUS_02492 [Endocarpon pusillum Z07020]|uniref:Uncharacterized protein n=1 Tax=Endocarpon pusillum (strain Z07020 / HMAS-L-300199) TaxID=1263415 RepID=U1GFW9_ENDPU|nr:uncharacterized protein EPUS_02492 [Endocarpon pusillum Z07020]ERF70626.1 hypothetical protein EPUS_02492 [Endocarpon pusillum Z07020]